MPNSDDGTYEVGRSRPPKGSQFEKGKSGNPRGRPKGSKNINTLLLDIGKETVSSREGGTEKRIQKSVAAIKLLFKEALSGNERSRKELLDRLLKAEEASEAASARAPSYPFSAVDRAVIEEVFQRLKSFDGK